MPLNEFASPFVLQLQLCTMSMVPNLPACLDFSHLHDHKPVVMYPMVYNHSTLLGPPIAWLPDLLYGVATRGKIGIARSSPHTPFVNSELQLPQPPLPMLLVAGLLYTIKK